jgi:hypothetical protein
MEPEERDKDDQSGVEDLEPIDNYVVKDPKRPAYEIYRADVAKAHIEARLISSLDPSVRVLILSATFALGAGLLAAATLVGLGKDLTTITPLFISYFSILGGFLTGMATFYVMSQSRGRK